jgi:hypothetical protein
MGVAPEAIAKIFGYRLKKIDKLVPYTSSRVICRLTRVNSTNVLDEGLKIGEIGRRMNSKVKLFKIGVYRK